MFTLGNLPYSTLQRKLRDISNKWQQILWTESYSAILRVFFYRILKAVYAPP